MAKLAVHWHDIVMFVNPETSDLVLRKFKAMEHKFYSDFILKNEGVKGVFKGVNILEMSFIE